MSAAGASGGETPMALVKPTGPWEGQELSCEAVDRDAVRYVFNGLRDSHRAAMRLHLDRCARCRRKLTLFEAAWAGRRMKPGGA